MIHIVEEKNNKQVIDLIIHPVVIVRKWLIKNFVTKGKFGKLN